MNFVLIICIVPILLTKRRILLFLFFPRNDQNTIGLPMVNKNIIAQINCNGKKNTQCILGSIDKNP